MRSRLVVAVLLSALGLGAGCGLEQPTSGQGQYALGGDDSGLAAAAAAAPAATATDDGSKPAPGGENKGNGNAGGHEAQPFAPKEVVVRFRPGVSDATASKVLARHGYSTKSYVPALNLYSVQLNDDDEKSASDSLASEPTVLFSTLNRVLPPSLIPNDPSYPSEWQLPKINAPAAWDTTTGGTSIVLAVLDTGVDATHPDLAGKLVAGWNVVDNTNNTADTFGHGTQVAGAAAAITNNGAGVAAPCWGCLIMPVRITDASGNVTDYSIAQGLTWAADHGALIANVSYGPLSGSSTVDTAAQYFIGKGGVVVTSEGNAGAPDGNTDDPNLLTVNATDQNDALASFSTTGEDDDLAAPGVQILTTNLGAAYATLSGTSFSAPITAGVAALLFAVNPALTSARVQEIIQFASHDLGAAGYDTRFGWGRLDAAAAVALASPPMGADTVAPHLHVSVPAPGAVLSHTTTLQARAVDDRGVVSVSASVAGVTVGSATAAPWLITWDTTTVASGSQTVVFTARDAAGNTTSSNVAVTVDNVAPTVSITAPAPNATIGGTATLTANATDNVAVQMVVFTIGQLSCGAYGSPWSCTLDTTQVAGGVSGACSGAAGARCLPNGPYTLSAQAWDSSNNTSTTSISVNVQNGVVTAITYPTASNLLSQVVPIAIDASAQTLPITVTAFVDGATLGTTSSYPYQINWTTNSFADGQHTLTARAVDGTGNIANSAGVTVTVDNTAPSARLTAPTAGALVHGTVSATMACTDATSGALSATFSVDGQQIATRTDPNPLPSVTMFFTWNSTGYANGAHTLSATCTDAAGNTGTAPSVSVTLDNTAPTVAFTAPASGATVGGTVTVSATASDNVAVASVAFSVDGSTSLGTITSAPYTVPWNTGGFANGGHTLTALATDTAGNTTSTSIPVTVSNSVATISFSAPTAGAYVHGSTTVQIAATDAHGITSVKLTVDGTSLGTLTAAPYNFTWNTATYADGSHSLVATVVNGQGNTNTASESVNVDNALPTVSFAAPAAGATVGGTYSVSINAANAAGISQVVFAVDNATVATKTSAPYTFAWNTTTYSGGAHTLKATATANTGLVNTATVSVTVDNVLPTVSITSPRRGATVSGTTTVSVSATDNTAVASVTLVLDGTTTIGTLTSAPYNFSWNTRTATNATHTVAATATDRAGNKATTSVSVTVRN